MARAATPERLQRVDIQVRAFYDVGDEDEAVRWLDEIYADVRRQIREPWWRRLWRRVKGQG